MNTLQQSNDLPSAIRKRLDYFPQLLDRLSNAPLWDVHETLDAALVAYKAGEEDLSQGLKFASRLKHYLVTTPMEPQRRERIENWAFWTRKKEGKFLDDLAMPEWKEVVTEADRATMEARLEVFSTTGRRIIEWDKDLDSAGKNAENMEIQIAQLEKRLSELNAARALDTPAATPDADAGAFGPLLLNYSLTELNALLAELGLLDAATGRATPAATPGAWVGVVHGLLDANPPRLRRSLAATGRALNEVFGAKVSESALQTGVSKRGSESERVKDATLALIAPRPAGD